ncbi:MAG: GNAT family N-acetyltransferase [Jatrophihabitans sp.]
MAEIIRATEQDWQQLRVVRLAALEADPSSFGSELARELAYPEDRWRAWTSGSACFLALVDRQPIGMIVARTITNADADAEVPTAEINAMWVAPEQRGSGVGRGLVTAALDWARAGHQQLVRLRVTSGNDAAIRLYEQQGFTPTGRTEPLLSDPRLSVLEYLLALA